MIAACTMTMRSFSPFSLTQDRFKRSVLDLIHAAKYVCIVLGDGEYARKTGELSALFIAIYHSGICVALGQFAITPLFTIIDLGMVRTAHRLHREQVALASVDLE